MNQNNDLRVLCGLSDPCDAARVPAMPPFAESVTALLAEVSRLLMAKRLPLPDVITFAFFCREANLRRLQSEAGDLDGRIGRGLTFHIAPGNVPVNFAYSLVAGLLAGNACIVKASSRDFEQTRILCDAFNAALEHMPELRPYVNVVAYPRERQELTERFSALCDVRVIWGGDETVRRVRQAPLAPRAFDLTFADRWSLLVASPASLLAMDERALSALAQGFYNDTYLTDQNACTSPRLVYWLAGDREAAKQRFWHAVRAYAAPRYPIEPVVAVDKRTALFRAAITLCGARLEPMPDSLVTRIRLDALTPETVDFRCAGGCFLEYDGDTLDALAPLLTAKAQTISYIGVDPQAIRRFVLEHGVRGVDRIAPVGHTMDFALTWDGYDLIGTLSRRVALA